MRKKARKYLVPHKENDFRPHLLRAGGLLLVAVFVFGALFASNIQRIILRASDLLASILPAVLVDLANADRAGENIAYLAVNPKLEEAARLKAKDMAEKGYFAHYSPEGVSPWHWVREAGYKFAYAGENLAINFDDSSAVNTAWMASPGHRANILNGKFTEIGIAAEKGIYNGRETIFVVQMFGAPAREITPIMTVEPQPTAPEESEDTLVPITTLNTNVLSETENEEVKPFIAVQNLNVEPAKVGTVRSDQSSQANFVEKTISSPTNFLGLLYSLLGVVLILMLYFALKTSHAHRTRHTVLIIIILVLIFSIFSVYQSRVERNVTLPLAQKVSL